MEIFENNNINFKLSDAIVHDLENNVINIYSFYCNIQNQNIATKKYIKQFLINIYETELFIQNLENTMKMESANPSLKNDIQTMISFIDINYC
jgi:hypothetical protein